MNSIELLEVVLIVAIIFIQILVFTKSFIRIRLFKAIFPAQANLKLSRILVPVSEWQSKQPGEILQEVNNYRHAKKVHSQSIPVSAEIVWEGDAFTDLDSSIDDHSNGYDVSEMWDSTATEADYIELNIIESEEAGNPVLQKILYSINTYLIRNKGAATDFNLIKDIVERNTDAVEQEINLTIALPLYLGLMGTMVGIVLGLFNMSDLAGVLSASQADDQLGQGISVLLGGVKIAMIASFMGLLLTVFNSGFYFKGARSLVETRKNDVYTFIQTELLPVINQSLAVTLESLQRNLLHFNDSFSVNLKHLSGLFQNNHTQLQQQNLFLEKLNELGIAKIAKYNIEVLQQMNKSVEEFSRFNTFLSQINEWVDHSKQLVTTAKSMYERTGQIEEIASSISSNMSRNEQLVNFLTAHMKEMEGISVMTRDSVINVNYTISDALNELKESTQKQLKQFDNFRIDEADALKKALTENKNGLHNLTYLENLNKDISRLKDVSAYQGEVITQELVKMNEVLQEMNQRQQRTLFRKIKNWFTEHI